MKKSKPVEAELLPSVDSILRSSVDKATLDRLVQQKVAEIMANRDALVFEPFFRSRQIAYELRRLQTMPEQRKWSIRYQRYGCLICETREQIHVGNGMCNRCHSREFHLLTQIIAEGMIGKTAQPSSNARLELRPTVPPTETRRALLPAESGVHRRWNKPRVSRKKPSGDD